MLSKSSRRLLGRQALEADFAATHADQDGEAQAGGATENELDTLQAVQPGTWFSPAFSSVAPSTLWLREDTIGELEHDIMVHERERFILSSPHSRSRVLITNHLRCRVRTSMH